MKPRQLGFKRKQITILLNSTSKSITQGNEIKLTNEHGGQVPDKLSSEIFIFREEYFQEKQENYF